jgi:hypothetical protein
MTLTGSAREPGAAYFCRCALQHAMFCSYCGQSPHACLTPCLLLQAELQRGLAAEIRAGREVAVTQLFAGGAVGSGMEVRVGPDDWLMSMQSELLEPCR